LGIAVLDDESSTLLRNVKNILPSETAAYPRRKGTLAEMSGYVLHVLQFRWYVTSFSSLNVQRNPVKRHCLFTAICGGMSRVVFNGNIVQYGIYVHRYPLN
jgi:hypothetical protein